MQTMKTTPLVLSLGMLLFANLLQASDPVTNFNGSSSYSSRLSVTVPYAMAAETSQSTNSEAAARASSGLSGPFLSTGILGETGFSRLSRMLTASLLSTGSLLNIDFGQGYTNTGFAAIRQTTNDIWNAYSFGYYDFAEMTGLVWADGSDSGITLVWNTPGIRGNDSERRYQAEAMETSL